MSASIRSINMWFPFSWSNSPSVLAALGVRMNPARRCFHFLSLEEPDGLAPLVDVHPGEGGPIAEARHQHDVPTQRDDEARAHRRHDIPDRKAEAAWASLLKRIVRQRQVGLGHAHGEVAQALCGEPLELASGFGHVFDPVSSVEKGG